jgi:hypothetical protein
MAATTRRVVHFTTNSLSEIEGQWHVLYADQNFMKTWTFLSPTTTVDLQNPQTFGKVRAEARTAEWGGQPIMHLTPAVSF